MKKGALLFGYARVSKLGAREDERGANANSQVEKPEITGHGQTDLRHRKNISVSEIDTYKSAKTIWHYIFARLTG